MNCLRECVVLLHGLARTSRSMRRLEKNLQGAGYKTLNVDYPSRKHDVAALAAMTLPVAFDKCRQYSPDKIHGVTHSMGGILLRYYLKNNSIDNLGRVVMLSPPSQGSEVVDRLVNVPGFRMFNGPAGCELGTDGDSVPNRLGPADFEVGVITGNRSMNLLLSTCIPGENDGKVSVERARLQGMTDFLVLPYTHSFIMQRIEVIHQVIYFLQHGHFSTIKGKR